MHPVAPEHRPAGTSDAVTLHGIQGRRATAMMATKPTGTCALRTIPLLLALACGVGCSEQKAKATAPPPSVIVAPVIQRDVPIYIEAVSSLDGYVNAEIRARVRGFLQAQKYKDGAEVKEGQLLFQIEPNEYAAAVATAQANVARARTAQEHGIVQLDRRKALLPSGVVSKQELDDATATAHDADGQLAAAQARSSRRCSTCRTRRSTRP